LVENAKDVVKERHNSSCRYDIHTSCGFPVESDSYLPCDYGMLGICNSKRERVNR